MSSAGFAKQAEAPKTPATCYPKYTYETKHLASALSYTACVRISSLLPP